MRKYCSFCGIEVDYKEYTDEKFVVLRDNSHAELWGNSHAQLWGNSHAVLRDNSHVVLRDNSHAELWGNSHAVLRDNSHAVLRDNSHAELWGNSHAQCRSPYACGILKSFTAKCSGRHIGDKPLSPVEYLVSCGVEIKNQSVILYKSVKSDLTNGRDGSFKYQLGKQAVAPDWNPEFNSECGCGLHLSPTVAQAKSFHDSKTYLACKVNIKDIAQFPAYAEYPDKIRVRACIPLYQVDENGDKLKPNRDNKGRFVGLK